MSMGKAADNIEGSGAGHIGFAPKCPLDHVDDVHGKVRDVAEGLVLHLVAIAVSATQQAGLISLAVVSTGNAGYMNRATSIRHTLLYRQYQQMSRGMQQSYWLHFALHLDSS
jgi:hypothetical protein